MFFLSFDFWFWMVLAISCLTLFTITARLLRQRLDAMHGLFLFFDGRHLRGVCPYRVCDRLEAIEADRDFRLYYHPRLAVGGDQRALAIVGSAVRDAFELDAPCRSRQAGFTDGQCLQLLIDFVHYVDFQKKTAYSIEQLETAKGISP